VLVLDEEKCDMNKGAPETESMEQMHGRSVGNELPHGKIQAWIEQISIHRKQIVELKGGSEYKEGHNIRRTD